MGKLILIFHKLPRSRNIWPIQASLLPLSLLLRPKQLKRRKKKLKRRAKNPTMIWVLDCSIKTCFERNEDSHEHISTLLFLSYHFVFVFHCLGTPLRLRVEK